MTPFLILIIYTLANIGCSYALLSIFSRQLGKYLPPCVMFSLGTAFLSTLWIFIGLAGFLHKEFIGSIVFIMALLSIPYLYNQIQISASSLRVSFKEVVKSPLYFLLILLVIAVVIWLGILTYMRAPAGDAAAFYMAYPKIISLRDKLTAMPGLFHDFSSIGISGELHYAVLMKLANPVIAKLFAWIVGISILFVLRSLTRYLGGGLIAQTTAVSILLTSSTYYNFLSDGKTDLFTTLLGITAVLCIVLIRERQFPKSLSIITGILTGFAISAKFSFIIALFPAIVSLLFWQEIVQNRDLKVTNPIRQSMFTLVLFGIGVLIALFPHLLKNEILFGNPLAPFFGMKNWADQSHWYAVKDTLWIASTYPFALVFGLYPLMGGTMSVLWIASFIFLLFLPKAKRSLQQPATQIMLCGCLGLLCWIVTKASVFVPRYFLATLIMLIPFPAIAVEYMWQTEIRPRLISICYALLAGIALCIAPFIPITDTGLMTRLAIKDIQHPEGHSTTCNIETSGYCYVYNSLNPNVAKGDRIYVMGYYTYWLRDDLIQCINQMSELNIQDMPSAKLWETLYQRGFMHLAVQKATHGAHLEKLDPTQAPKWLKITKEYTDTSMPIFHLEAINPPKPREISCVNEGNSYWRPKKTGDS